MIITVSKFAGSNNMSGSSSWKFSTAPGFIQQSIGIKGLSHGTILYSVHLGPGTCLSFLSQRRQLLISTWLSQSGRRQRIRSKSPWLFDCKFRSYNRNIYFRLIVHYLWIHQSKTHIYIVYIRTAMAYPGMVSFPVNQTYMDYYVTIRSLLEQICRYPLILYKQLKLTWHLELHLLIWFNLN